MGIRLQNTDTLDAILSLKHLWPRGDLAIMDVIRDHGCASPQPVSTDLITVTRIHESFPIVRERLRISQAESRRRSYDGYVMRGAPGSEPYTGDR